MFFFLKRIVLKLKMIHESKKLFHNIKFKRPQIE